MKELFCLRCGAQMYFAMQQKLQMGKTSWIFGDWPNLLAGAMEVEIYTCPKCGKIEFFQAESGEVTGRIAQKKCPNCGQMHDLDDPKCPFCKYDYYYR